MTGCALWLDGARVEDPVAAPPGDQVGAFETMGAVAGELPLWDRHLDRWQQARRRLGDPDDRREPGGLDLRSAARALLRDNGHGDGVLRLLRTFGPRAANTWLTTRARGPGGLVTLIPTVTRRPAGAPPGDLKATPRTFYDAVLAEARAASAEDGVVLGDDGAVLETAVANLWLLLDGVWVTPGLDGRVLPGVARGLLLERAPAAGLAVAERACDLGDLHRAAALAVSNAVHGVRPAALLAARADVSPSAVEIVDSSLGRLWRSGT